MQGNVIKEFLVSLGFKVDKAGEQGFTAGIGKATLAVAGIGAATFAAAAAITAFVSSVANEIDVVSDLAGITGTAASEIERLGYIATMTDSSVQSVNSGLAGMSRLIGQAATGVGRGAKYFKQYGLEVRKANGDVKNAGEMMGEVSEYIKDLSKQEQISILNRLGLDPTMLQMMTKDTSALSAEFNALYAGAGYNADQAAAASSDFVDSQLKLKYVFDTLRKSIAVQFMPQLTRAMESLRKGFITNLPRIIATVKPILGGILDITSALFQLGGRAAEIIGSIDKKILIGIGIVLLWRNAISMVTKAWAVLNSTFLASPLGIVLALSAAILLLYDDFKTWQEGGESFFNWEPAINAAIGAVVWLTDKVNALIGVAKKAVDTVKELFTIDFSKFTSFSGIKGMLDSTFGRGNGGYLGNTAKAGTGGAQVSQTITQNIQTNDPLAAGRASARENNRALKDLAHNFAWVPAQ